MDTSTTWPACMSSPKSCVTDEKKRLSLPYDNHKLLAKDGAEARCFCSFLIGHFGPACPPSFQLKVVLSAVIHSSAHSQGQPSHISLAKDSPIQLGVLLSFSPCCGCVTWLPSLSGPVPSHLKTPSTGPWPCAESRLAYFCWVALPRPIRQGATGLWSSSVRVMLTNAEVEGSGGVGSWDTEGDQLLASKSCPVVSHCVTFGGRH